MELVELVRLGTPALVLGMLLLLERINGKVNDIQGDVRELRHNITWKDTCDARHEEINRRLGAVDRVSRGG